MGFGLELGLGLGARVQGLAVDEAHILRYVCRMLTVAPTTASRTWLGIGLGLGFVLGLGLG